MTDAGEVPPILTLRSMNRIRSLGITALSLGLSISACNCEEGGLVDVKPELSVSAESLDFGDVPVGDLRLRGLKLKNLGGVELTFSQFALTTESGEFVFATAALTKLNPNEELDFNLVFEPRDAGEETGTLVLEANDNKGPRTINLRGRGVISGVGVEHAGPACGDTEGSLSFGSVTPGNMVEKTITVRATGSSPVTVLSAVRDASTSSEMSIEEIASPRTIAPGETVTLRASYAPVDGGPDSGAFIITTDAPAMGTIRIPVCGEGAAPAICSMPVNFGVVGQGTVNTKTMTLTSCGSEPVDLTAVAISSDAAHPSNAGFRIVNSPSLPRTLAPTETVDVEVEFSSTVLGVASGYVQIDSTAYGVPRAWVNLSATVAQPCGIYVAPTSVTFNNVAPMTTDQRAVLVGNSGASSCTISNVAIATGAGVFSLTPMPLLPTQIASGGSQTFQVQYAPQVANQTDMGTLIITDGGGTTVTVPLTGNPTPEKGCQVEVVPAFVNFGVVPPNGTRTMAVSLNNISDEFCTLRGVDLDPSTHPDFANTSPSFGIILPGRSKIISVTYRPTAQGAATGSVNIETSDVDTPIVNVPLFASSAPTGICVMPRHLPFGPASGLETQIFTIYACGAQTVTVNALDWTMPNPEFALQAPPALPFTLNPGDTRDITVGYMPADMIGDTAIVTVRSDDLAEPAIDVTVTGGPEIVPVSAGRYLYYWQIPNLFSGGDIMQLPLQGNTTATPYWGPRAGKQCSGCHQVSPDGRYVAIIETTFRVVDTQTNIALSLPNQVVSMAFMSWRPDVNTNPPYQYVYDDSVDIHVAALFDGYIGTLAGASDSNYFEQMPHWGPNGQIAFARGAAQAQGNSGEGTWGLQGECDVLVVPEQGGTAVLVPNASNNNQANYYPRFSPDGRWISFTQSAMAMSTIAAPDSQIRLTRGDLSGPLLSLPTLNGNNGASSYPTWSVDGSFLSFSSNRSGGAGDWDIYIAPIDPTTGMEGAPLNVNDANSPSFEHSAQWSP